MKIEQKIIEFTPDMLRRHDMCLRVLGPMLDTAGYDLELTDHQNAALKWALIESLCLMVGRRSSLPDRVIAEQVERIAESILKGV